jgi:hypothetical protein
MITNPKQVGEGLVLFPFASGEKVQATVRLNDRENEVFWLEQIEGDFETLPYSKVKSIRNTLRLGEKLKSVA